MTLNELKERLKIDIPSSYIEFIENTDEALQIETNHDVKSVCILNLENREYEWGPNKNDFIVGDDGGGDYYVITDMDSDAKIKIWDHEIEEYEDTEERATDFLRSKERSIGLGIGEWKPDGLIFIYKTDTLQESILDPISLQEWQEIAKKFDEIEWIGFRETDHPFTGKLIRTEAPGYCLLNVSDKTYEINYGTGSLVFNTADKEVYQIANAITDELKANNTIRN